MNDRGSIKWTAMMLPEHAKMLKEVWEENDKKEKPLLDEQQIEEINRQLQLAITNNKTVKITYFDKNDFHQATGKVKKLNSHNGTLHLDDDNSLPFASLLNVSIS